MMRLKEFISDFSLNFNPGGFVQPSVVVVRPHER